MDINPMNLRSPQTSKTISKSHAEIAFKHPAKHRLAQGIAGLFMISLLTSGGYLLYRQFVLLPQQQEQAQTQTVEVETTTLPIMVTANGTVEAEQLTNVSPKTSERLEEVTVAEGDAVEAGQALAYMDDSDLQGQLIETQGQLASARANLAMLVAGNRPQEIAQAEANLADAEASLSQAEENFRRYEVLYEQGAVSAEETTGYRTARDTAQAQVKSAQQALDLSQSGSRQEEIAQAEAAVMEAEGAFVTIMTQIEDAVIRAPFSGVVTARYADPGDFVSPSTAASETDSSSSSSILSLASNYQVVASVAEADIAQIQPGQTASITADAYPDRQFEGTVAQVAEQATVSSDVTSFEVRVNLSEAVQSQLRPGMNVDVEFQAGELTDVLVVPTVAIVREEQGEGVLVMGRDGTPRFLSIETGLTVDDKTEVISGLEGDEQIVLSAAQGLPENLQNRGGSPLLPGGGAGGNGPPRGGGPGG
ncbi:efflux RND transporter periplasmic adaptor subunit [Oscillatoria sp. CS-180]|uniref:efflux RND transporter periplasmic adaptor subunit n=1 Tax=Oscillatoria sp. CS-180 TaxID=3021720 RepID=UPI00232D0FD4|nr:efflux RND transporter periplasmic adaptor subunit [Oscillatoria sp. CS-180]MDB9526490.1 efflux RND transporter periplasmic adaptor subunit [Oscillatoria sp. CS-180]